MSGHLNISYLEALSTNFCVLEKYKIREREQILLYAIPFDPQIFLWLNFEHGSKFRHQLLLVNLLSIALVSIAKHWESEILASKIEWESI